QELVVVVIRLERLGQLQQVLRHQVRLQQLAGGGQELGPAADRGQQLQGGGAVQVERLRQAVVQVEAQAALGQLPQQAADARVRELHVVHRVVQRLAARQVDVEHQLRIGLARHQEPARGVAPGLV